jgi:hypothetical protein
MSNIQRVVLRGWDSALVEFVEAQGLDAIIASIQHEDFAGPEPLGA